LCEKVKRFEKTEGRRRSTKKKTPKPKKEEKHKTRKRKMKGGFCDFTSSRLGT